MVDSKLRELGEIVSSPENISKNPVSLLMEAAAQVKESASFHCIDELTLSNMKLFTCEVKIGRLLKCRGTGPNKKAAKASAAENALESMRTRAGLSGNSPRISQQVTPTLYSQQSSPAASFSPNTCFNPVGSLQEMCIKNNWSPPQYDLIREAGEAHSKTFICECKVGSWVAQGQGKKKKDAKRLAAENLLSMITQGTPTNNKRKKQEKEKLEKRLRKSPQGAEAGPSRTPFRNFPDQGFGTVGASNSFTSLRTPLRSSSFLSSQLYDSVEDDEEEVASVGSAASSSPIEDISQEFCSSLEDKGKKSGFSVEYHDLSQKGYSGNYLCFVRLTTQPPAVCSGMGPTKTCAYEKAAKNALQYLSTVCS